MYSCYLPPEGSPWADTSSFYGHLISQLYLNSYADNIFVAVDFIDRVSVPSPIAFDILMDTMARDRAHMYLFSV